jgi:3',5'-nucleoside bisphosphate phosphatase
MLKPFLADLHIHTVLSACAEVEMIPPLIVERARRMGLGLIAITDHNACFNAEAVMKAADGTGLHVLPGMELQTVEEVHVLCLFDDLIRCRRWQEEVSEKLPPLPNKEEVFGSQFVVDATGEWIRTEDRLLATSTEMTLDEVAARVHLVGGMVIPAHVDRPSFSLFSNLGFLPDHLEVDAMEVTSRFVPETGTAQWPELRTACLIVGGDAHRLSEIQNRTLFKIASPAIEEVSLAPATEEVSLAFRGEQGRKVVVDWMRDRNDGPE